MSEHDQNNETIAWKNGAEAANGGWRDDPRVTAYALGELEALDEESIAAIAGAIARDPELRQYVEDLRATGETLCVGLGATESSSVKGGRLASALSAEALMAAAFEDEAPTQTVSTVSEKPHAAAGSGRRAREATRPAPSPFRRYFALGAVAATLVISVLVGLLVASYGQMSPSSSVAVDMPTPAQDQAASNTLDLDTALEFQIGKFKAGNGITIDGVHNDANLSADVQENLSVQHEKLGAFIASVTDAADAQPGSGSATSSSGGTSSGAGWMGAEVNMETAVAPRAAVIQRHNQKISELLEEVDRVTDENLKIGEERLQTSDRKSVV